MVLKLENGLLYLFENFTTYLIESFFFHFFFFIRVIFVFDSIFLSDKIKLVLSNGLMKRFYFLVGVGKQLDLIFRIIRDDSKQRRPQLNLIISSNFLELSDINNE